MFLVFSSFNSCDETDSLIKYLIKTNIQKRSKKKLETNTHSYQTIPFCSTQKIQVIVGSWLALVPISAYWTYSPGRGQPSTTSYFEGNVVHREDDIEFEKWSFFRSLFYDTTQRCYWAFPNPVLPVVEKFQVNPEKWVRLVKNGR